METLKKWFLKLIGKNLDSKLDKWGISKTKVISVLGALIGAYGIIAPAFQLPPIPKEAIEILAALGLWTLRDAIHSVPPSV